MPINKRQKFADWLQLFYYENSFVSKIKAYKKWESIINVPICMLFIINKTKIFINIKGFYNERFNGVESVQKYETKKIWLRKF